MVAGPSVYITTAVWTCHNILQNMKHILCSYARRSEVHCLHTNTQVSLIFANVAVHDVLIQAELDALEAAHPGRFKACLPSCLAGSAGVQPTPEELLLSGRVPEWHSSSSDAACAVVCTLQVSVLPGRALAPYAEVYHFSTCLCVRGLSCRCTTS